MPSRATAFRGSVFGKVVASRGKWGAALVRCAARRAIAHASDLVAGSVSGSGERSVP